MVPLRTVSHAVSSSNLIISMISILLPTRKRCLHHSWAQAGFSQTAHSMTLFSRKYCPQGSD